MNPLRPHRFCGGLGEIPQGRHKPARPGLQFGPMTRLRRIADRDRIFFVTTNLQAGVAALSSPERHLLLKQLARQHDAGEFLLFAYVVMPTHVHLLFAPRRVGLISIMREFKSRTAQQLTATCGVKGPIWQPRYFDFVLRRVGDFWDKLEYIHQNPVEAQLVEARDSWPCSSAAHYDRKDSIPVRVDEIDLPGDRRSWLRTL
jgi:putative transposase